LGAGGGDTFLSRRKRITASGHLGNEGLAHASDSQGFWLFDLFGCRFIPSLVEKSILIFLSLPITSIKDGASCRKTLRKVAALF
jgi:hypothetical protein